MNSLFDAVLQKIGSAPDDVGALAAKVGIDPKMVEQALASLSQTVTAPGDTIDLAAKHTGIGKDVLARVVQQLGGENALNQMASQFSRDPAELMKMLDQNGDNNPITDLADMMAKGLFGKK
jgi:hypothetical protein